MESNIQRARMVGWEERIEELREKLKQAGVENTEYRLELLDELSNAYASLIMVIDLEIELNKAKINP
jgi:hypothetical protein